ncbi:MAG: hypothetical protein PHE06_13830, partial [Lachnospiraceae bacterium]|nr:hypothetical protein [Lachnospiraceae bacterium]
CGGTVFCGGDGSFLRERTVLLAERALLLAERTVLLAGGRFSCGGDGSLAGGRFFCGVDGSLRRTVPPQEIRPSTNRRRDRRTVPF